jgi:hypothetical protein
VVIITPLPPLAIGEAVGCVSELIFTISRREEIIPAAGIRTPIFQSVAQALSWLLKTAVVHLNDTTLLLV